MKTLPVLLLLLSNTVIGQIAAQAQEDTYQGPFIDAHSHTPTAEPGNLETNIGPTMDQAGVTRIVLMGHEIQPDSPIGEEDRLTLTMYENYPNRVIPFLGCIRWGHSLRDPSCLEYADKQLAAGKFKGVGQLIIKRYRSHDPKDPDSKISSDLSWNSPMAQNLVHLVAKYNVPIMFMMETTPETLVALDRVLRQNPKTRFIWNHQNQLQDRIGPTPELRALSGDPQRVATLMEKYPNLFIDLTIGRDAVVRTVSDRQIPENWRTLYEKYIDRIIIGVDADTQKSFENRYLSEVNWIRSWISQLSSDAAKKKLAYENIERILTKPVATATIIATATQTGTPTQTQTVGNINVIRIAIVVAGAIAGVIVGVILLKRRR